MNANTHNFLDTSFVGANIDLVLFVTKRLTSNRIINRKGHGLVYYARTFGRLTFTDGTVIRPQSGQVVYLPENSTYDIDVSDQRDEDGCYAINFACPNLDGVKPFAFDVRLPSLVETYFVKSEKAWRERRPGFAEKCLECLYGAIALMKSAAYSPSSHRETIRPAVDFIHENYSFGKISIPCLATTCGISEVYLRKLFAETYGVSPVEYINRLRVDRAKELLSVDYHISSSEISALCGLSDYYYFCRLFKRATGLTPKEYRKMNETAYPV